MEGKAVEFNFFNWVREGVRQSVLLGVSDAVEQIGTPPDSEELNEQVSKLLAPQEPETKTTKRVAATKRKRLGRSLKEIEGGAATT